MKITKFSPEDARWILSLCDRFLRDKEEFERLHIWTGEKFTPDLTRNDVSRLVRSDISAAIISGHLPASKYRVSTRRSKVSKRKAKTDSVNEFELVIRGGEGVEVGTLEEIARSYNRSRVEEGASFQARLFFQVRLCRLD